MEKRITLPRSIPFKVSRSHCNCKNCRRGGEECFRRRPVPFCVARRSEPITCRSCGEEKAVQNVEYCRLCLGIFYTAEVNDDDRYSPPTSASASASASTSTYTCWLSYPIFDHSGKRRAHDTSVINLSADLSNSSDGQPANSQRARSNLDSR